MNPDTHPESAAAQPPLGGTTAATDQTSAAARKLVAAVGLVAVAALLVSGLLWQKLSSIQERLARQSADTGAQSLEARVAAKQAQELAHETAARVAVFDARLSEVALQRGQLEELIQSLSRSRDENLVVDVESSIRLAQQQAQLTGSVAPLLGALKSAQQRVAGAAQPRLTRLQQAIGRDVVRLQSAAVSDIPNLLVKLDELARLADELVLANAVASAKGLSLSKVKSSEVLSTWWQRGLQRVLDEARGLMRVSRVEQPEAALLSPEQSFFVRENLKLKLLNARLGLLARQLESARADLVAAELSLNKYFDPSSRKTKIAAAVLQQVQAQIETLRIPHVDETLAALTTAAAGR